ncbi:hypothetical protein F0562_014430 [Nyssa sinensis]|uniref:Uncharacterized protein n=1 Tax=Nyssa sinensis TaxID=561372 RepID=A0A5J4ZQM3_9ASTE|nr:hypothetical protein F0562_014430 [Nyssa sinensis]
MGAKFCCLRQSSSEPQPKQLAGSPDQDVADPSFSKPKCLEKREFQSPDNSVTMVGSLSLEECLLASPAGLNSPSCISTTGELPIFKHFSQKMVHSSSPKVHKNFFSPRNSFSSDRLGKIDEENEEDSLISATSTRRRGKLKKRVTFNLPEEADIIIFYSPKQTFEE